MWVLSHIKTGRRFYLLTSTKKYTVGRTQQCDLFLKDDTSVSRDHAVIHRSSSGVRVEDKESKYGVYVNNGIDSNKGIAQNTPIELHAGNIVRFGRLENIFRLENISVNVCTSTLEPADIEKLRKQLKVIDGSLQPKWNTECTHLVMENVTVTIKVLQSLAYGVPIVSPDYFAKYIESAEKQNQHLPDVKDFVPEITEPYIIKEPGMMDVHLDRQRLFQNKTFVFMVQRHMLKFEPIIKLAAGKTLNIETDKVTKSQLLEKDYIPVRYVPSANTQRANDIDGIEQYILSNERRLINDSEIGLAIIHRAIDRFCNPDRKMVTYFEPEQVNTHEIIGNVLVQDTPLTTNTPKGDHNSVTVPETIELTGSEPNNNLRSSEVIDLDKPSTSSTRRSTRSSLKSSNESTNWSGKSPTPKKNAQKRRLDEGNDQKQRDENEVTEREKDMAEKRQKVMVDGAAESQGESSSAHFVAPMPPQSPSDHNFSGFISTQNRKRKTTQEHAAATQSTPVASESSKVTNKRAIDMLNADSDDEQNESDDHNFNFSRKPKRIKGSPSKRAHLPERNTATDNDNDDEDGDLFGFSKKPSRSQKQKSPQQKSTQKKKDETDAHLITESQNSYKKPFQRTHNRSLNHTIVPVEISSVPQCDAEWISIKIKKELNLNDTRSDAQPSSSVKVKDEELDEWEMTKEEKKRLWIKSMANVFTVRKVEVNQSRRSMIDEVDSRLLDSEDTSHNKSKNFKKFVKKNNFIPRTVVIKTTSVPVTISHFARI